MIIYDRHIRQVRAAHLEELDAIEDETLRLERLVELNVIAQTHAVCRNSSIIDAKASRNLSVHGLVYNIQTGQLIDLHVPDDPYENVFRLK